ncbi:methyltransferase domain-containing protein [Flavobacteriaceae bacterium F89]|uniref:Methyltransferase domain-containing protein n=1 Tax=Cerina litoralis TaxID=2874477 RepID=A0AAE3JNW9_9FLAO|nr:methyltransferase domain-containing protein [Cerina litoralis]MCG2461505.1 methyltransferase domain-containing protein [Cerina litoralis]
MISTEASKISKAWDGIAINFDRYVTPTANWILAKTAISLAGLRSGMHFLDVASGSGALSLPAARLGAKVLAVDISPVMIERLKARADEEGLSNLKGQVMDGHHLDLNDNTFDIAGSQFGVMLFPNFQRGLSELVRITRPGGTVFLVNFGPIQKVEFLNVFIGAIQEAVPGFKGLSPEAPPLPFQISEEDVLQKKMEEAGLRNVKVNPVVHKLSFRSGREMWNWVTSSNPIATQMISGLDDKQKNQVVKILEEKMEERSKGQEPAILEVAVNIGIGEKVK